MFEGYDPIWTDWLKVEEMYRAERDWEEKNFPGSWRHELYAGYMARIELLLSVSAFDWSEDDLVAMERYGAIGEAFWTKRMGKGRKK